jgi:hypothetical protein
MMMSSRVAESRVIGQMKKKKKRTRILKSKLSQILTSLKMNPVLKRKIKKGS